MVIVIRPQLRHYSIAALTVLLALLLMLLLDPWVAMKTSPFVMFFGAVMVSAWYGGREPGVLATFLSALISGYFFLPPIYSLALDLTDFVRLSLFVLEGILISVLCGALLTSNQQLKRSLSRLQASEERYRRLIDTAYEGIWTINPEGRIEYVNQRMAEMLGYSVQEMLDRSIFEFMNAASRVEAQRNIEQGNNGITKQYDFRFRRKDGSDLWTIVSTNPILSATGEFVGTLLMITDVSDRVLAEQERTQLLASQQAAQKQITNILESISDAFVALDSEWRYTYVNAKAEQLLQKTRKELVGRIIWEVFPPMPNSQYLMQANKAISEQVTIEYEEFNQRLNRWLLVRIYPSLDGQAIYFQDVSERKQAEEALQKQEEQLRLITNALPVLISYVDSEQRYRFNNKAYEDWLGHSSTQVYGKQIQEVVGESAYETLRPYIEAVLSGEQVSYESQVSYQDGTTRYISATYIPRFGSQEDVEGFVALVSDITARKQAELALRDSEARFRRLFESNIIGVTFTDIVRGDITDANDAFLEMVGYTREEVQQGKVRWKDMTPPEYDYLDERAIEEIRISGVCTAFEKEYICKDGSRVPILLAGALLEGSKQHTICYVLNLTERKQAIEALQESEERFRQMADTCPVLIWMSGLDKLCNYFNKGWLDFTGRTMEQELGNGWCQGVHPDDLEYCFDTYTNAFDAQQAFTMEYRLRRFDGEYRWIIDIGIPRFTPEGNFLGYIGSGIDISDRKQAEAEIRQFNEILEQRVKERTLQLEAANKELESFSYSVSHDLRAPLRHISGFVELLQKRTAATLDETSLRYLNIIAQTTKHAGTLIDNLLSFSRMGRTEMRYTSVNMAQLVREVQRDIELETNGRAIRWKIEELPQIQGDPSMLRLVLSNLLENAVKYTQRRVQAEIQIGSTDRDGEVVFFIRDNGVGFDMRYVHKLFGVFQRLHSAEDFNGTGIGLANVRRIIHRHGGQTWAEGVVDGGATFYFSLPKLA